MASALASASPSAYDALIAQQQARITQLERDLARSSDKLSLLKARAPYALPLRPARPPPDLAAVLHAQSVAAAAAGAVGAEDDDRAGKTRYWTEMEHNQFLYAVKLFGPKNYVAISQFVGTRTPKQVRTHAQKYQMKLEREARKRRTQTGGGVAAALAGQHAAAVAAAAAAAAQREVLTASVAVGEAGSASTTVGGSGSDAGMEFDFLCAEATSPISESFGEDVDGDVGGVVEGAPVVEMPVPVALGAGLKKNASLTNLADYDDFMRKITSAVNDRVDHGVMGFASASHISLELDADDLETHVKAEQFEDSLLVDM